MLEKLGIAGKLDSARAGIDAIIAPAKRGGSQTGKNPAGRGKRD